MPDFIQRFGERGEDGEFFLSSSRQSIITSLLSAGCVRLYLIRSHVAFIILSHPALLCKRLLTLRMVHMGF